MEEAQRIVLRLLRRRIGVLSETQEVQIRRLSLQRLEELTDAVLDFTQPGDLETWLIDASSAQQEN